MNQSSHNGSHPVAVVEDKPATPALPGNPAGPSDETGKSRYVPEQSKQEASLKERANVLLAGAGIIIAVLLLGFARLSHPPVLAGKTSVLQPKKTSESSAAVTESTIPINDESRSVEQQRTQGTVGPEEIDRTAAKHRTQPVVANLGAIQAFDGQNWQPPGYQVNGQEMDTTDADIAPSETRNERDALEKASLVFIRSAPASLVSSPRDNSGQADPGIGLPAGTRLRARIESAVNTAVQTPVIAVVEYNYEQNGEIVVPAGAKVLGHLEAADRSGYVSVRFDSLMLPDSSLLGMQGVATDLQLRPLKGKVEGKHTAKNIVVRSFAGLGEITATLAGRGSVNQPLSDGDLLRARAADNIAQASDEQLTKLSVTEHIVVTVPASTEIYVILQKPTRTAVQPESRSPTRVSPAESTTDQLRQLLQLHRELNQAPTPASANQ
jgi:hypothetical protein